MTRSRLPLSLSRPLLPLCTLTALLSACGPNPKAPESVARRYMEAQLAGKTQDMVALTTAADQQAADLPPNTTDGNLHPDKGTLELLGMMAKRTKVTRQEPTISGDQGQVKVTVQRPDLDISDLVPGAMFGAKMDDEAVRKTIAERVDKAALSDDVTTLNLVRENGEWRVNTDWAEKAEARKKADAEAARQARLNAMKGDYDSGLREDFGRAEGALNQLIAAFPNDAGWKRELEAVKKLRLGLTRLGIKVTSAELDQGEYRIKATVNNQNAFPLSALTVKYTFMNGQTVVGSPVYDRYTSSSFFSSRILDPHASNTLEGTGTPPAEWTGHDLRAEINAYQVDE